MAVRLSRRMQALAALVEPCQSLADVGCDHAYLSLALLASGKVKRALAMDIRPGPLERAREHIAAEGMTDRIEVRLSNGLASYRPGETEAILISGMGGGLIRNILEADLASARAAGQIVLGAQSDLPVLRSWLLAGGFVTLAQDLVEEGGKWYFLARVRYQEESQEERSWTSEELAYGKLLIENKHPLLAEYLRREAVLLKRILEALPRERTKRREEIQKKLSQNQTARLRISEEGKRNVQNIEDISCT